MLHQWRHCQKIKMLIAIILITLHERKEITSDNDLFNTMNPKLHKSYADKNVYTI